ncbi:SOS response-associated peptidase [Shimia aestuarii]|uniref:Abasic site processing protein n=1 Tax=Shimia aestuarii TaxID=254406 RepID=A0A1I4HM60_9RHOB|nr:SOS response-associated peptidase family protein [Shimia aestuarii]SFL43262.1 Putative SOS response-associated peptidase YedK [Shimia aestuarii]
MPGRFFLTTPMAEIAAWMEVDAPAEEPPRQNIQPGQEIVCFTDNGFQRMRWGIIPVGRVNARGRPVMETIINARSETVFDKSAFDGVGRAVVILDGWYEWTGEKRRKTAWRLFGPEPLIFAAITDEWTAPGGLKVPQVAMVTCEPNADVAPIHHRMGVLLRREDVALWILGNKEDVAPLMVPWPNGLLRIEEAGDVDWSGP